MRVWIKGVSNGDVVFSANSTDTQKDAFNPAVAAISDAGLDSAGSADTLKDVLSSAVPGVFWMIRTLLASLIFGRCYNPLGFEGHPNDVIDRVALRILVMTL